MSGGAEMLAIARRFAKDEVEPNAAAWERDRHFPRETIRAAAGQGLCGLLVPRDLGGAGLSLAEFCDVMGAIAHADMAFAFALVPHNNFARSMAADATQAQRARYLPAMLDGSRLGAFLLTEPEAGTDATAIGTTAVRHGEGWVLKGEKAWVTGGVGADLLRVYAQTDPGSGGRGIAAFLVHADDPGVIRNAAYEMLGCHATGAAGFRFENVALSADRLFTPPGETYRAAMEAIGLARVVVAALCVGILRRGLDVAVRYVRERHAFGAPLSNKQGLRWMLDDVATDLEAADRLTRAAAGAVDRAETDAAIMVAHAKKFAARAATDGLAQCMQALGANGFRHDTPIARHYAAAKMAHYIDGTTEVQNLVIARALFDRPSWDAR